MPLVLGLRAGPDRVGTEPGNTNMMNDLEERAKELRCIYSIDAILSDRSQALPTVFDRVLAAIPAGWQDPQSTGVRIEYLGCSYSDDRFTMNREAISESLRLWGTGIGRVMVSRTAGSEVKFTQAFLDEEKELLHRIAVRLGEFLEWKQSELLSERAPQRLSHWAWRQRFAEALANSIDTNRYSVKQVFLGGSTARGDAGPASDIDVYIVCDGSPDQHRDLAVWLDGWSRCLGEVALQQTGQHFPGGILNVQWLVAEPDFWQTSELQELKITTRRVTST